MISKIISVRPSRISGWCFDPAAPESAVTVDLLVNGQLVAVLPCNQRRRELDPAQFPNRLIGFAGQLPFEYWTGETIDITLRLSQDGSVLDQRELATPDRRIPGAEDLFGEVNAITAGRLSGWAKSKAGPVGLDLAIDGQPFARAEATSDMSGAGFALWLPDDIYDGATHKLVLTARLTDGGLAQFATLEQVFAPQEARQLTGLVTRFEQGRLSGTIQIAGWPDEAVTLVAEADGVEIGRAVSVPAQEGSFSLDLEPVVGLVPGLSKLEIYEEVSGLTPAFLDGDLLVRFLQASLRTVGQKGVEPLELSLTAPVHMAGSIPARIEADTADGLVMLPLDLALQPDGLRLVAQINLQDLPEAPLSLRLCLAGDIVLDLAVPQRASLEPAGPAFEAEWSLLPGGIVQGWVRATTNPDAPVTVALHLNHVEVMQGLADLSVLLSGTARARLPVACGFRFDLAQLGRKAGVAQVTITGPGGIQLQGTGSNRQRFPVASAAAVLQPGALLFCNRARFTGWGAIRK